MFLCMNKSNNYISNPKYSDFSEAELHVRLFVNIDDVITKSARLTQVSVT